VFVSVYVLLYSAYMQIPNQVLMRTVYYRGIVWPGAALINLLSAADPVLAVGNRIESHGAILEIVRGCDGAGVLFLLVAAILALRGSIRRVLWGLAGALVFVYMLNLLRIVVLYFATRDQGDWFLPLHSYVFPTLFVLLALVYFSLWSRPTLAISHEPAGAA
jgi:exosortase family protein XrtM